MPVDHRKVHLTFIITDLDTGGAEMMLLRLVQRINRDIFACRVISITDDGVIGEKIRAAGIPVLNLGMKTEHPNPFLLFKLIKWLLEEKPDLIQTWLYHADLVGGLAGWLVGVPVIWNIRNATLHSEGKQRTGMVVKLLAWLSHIIPIHIVSCSQIAMENHICLGYPFSKFEIIPNGFDTSLFHPDPVAARSLRKELGLEDQNQIVGHLARFDPQKDHYTLIKAAQILVNSLPNVRFVLCGDQITWNNSKLAGWIDEAGLRNHFFLLGRRDDTARIMAGLDFLVSSSVGEAFPTVLGEAMACEIPCVATDVGDSRMIIGDTGMLVQPSNPNLLAQGLFDLLTQPALQKQLLGKNARKRVIEQFDLPAIVGKYEKSFLQVLGR